MYASSSLQMFIHRKKSKWASCPGECRQTCSTMRRHAESNAACSIHPLCVSHQSVLSFKRALSSAYVPRKGRSSFSCATQRSETERRLAPRCTRKCAATSRRHGLGHGHLQSHFLSVVHGLNFFQRHLPVCRARRECIAQACVTTRAHTVTDRVRSALACAYVTAYAQHGPTTSDTTPLSEPLINCIAR